jgi:hypothetical protein
MRRFTVPFLVVAVLVMSVVAASLRSSVDAQEATPAGMSLADHPVVGAWRWTNAPGDPIPYTFAIFHDDGTYTEVTMGAGTGIGTWRPTGERTADLTAFFQDLDPSVEGFEPGTIKVLAAVTVDEDGTTAKAPYTVEASTPDGTVVFASEPMAGTMTRVELEPMGAVGTPIAATPTP